MPPSQRADRGERKKSLTLWVKCASLQWQVFPARGRTRGGSESCGWKQSDIPGFYGRIHILMESPIIVKKAKLVCYVLSTSYNFP